VMLGGEREEIREVGLSGIPPERLRPTTLIQHVPPQGLTPYWGGTVVDPLSLHQVLKRRSQNEPRSRRDVLQLAETGRGPASAGCLRNAGGRADSPRSNLT